MESHHEDSVCYGIKEGSAMNADEYHQQQLEEQRRLEEDPEFREAFEKVFGKMYTKDKIKNVRAQVVLEQNFKRYKEKFNGPT